MIVDVELQMPDLPGALCTVADAERFFPGPCDPARDAKALCTACPVRQACLQWALDHDEPHGIWGGFSAVERRELRRIEGRLKRCRDCGGPRNHNHSLCDECRVAARRRTVRDHDRRARERVRAA